MKAMPTDCQCHRTIDEWRRERIAAAHGAGVSYGSGRSDVTLLAYCWGLSSTGGVQGFRDVELAVRESWLHCGLMKTVIVTDQPNGEMLSFAENYACVSLQIEPSLVAGSIYSMSRDCNSKLSSRFDTEYVLIVQNDGWPLRKGLDEFVGRWDFIGGSHIRNIMWKRIAARIMRWHPMNGGFSLRTHECCDRAAWYWNNRYASMGDCAESCEDYFYTEFLPRKEPAYRRAMRFPDVATAHCFSHIELGAGFDAGVMPFGFHGLGAFTSLQETFGNKF